MQILFCLILVWGLVMAKYTSLDVKSLANVMRTEAARGRPFAFLTGAGCSISAGIPSVPNLLKRINEHEHGEPVRHRLGCASLEDQDYGEVMGCLTLTERKDILDPLLKNAKVNWGHIALAALMKANYVGRVLSFNFDSVLASAAGANGFYPATYDFGVSPAESFDHIVTPSVLHLHGQGYGLAMMNSTDETMAHAAKLEPLFRDTFQHSNVLIVGYSGKSDKTFEYIEKAYSNQKRIYWCNYEDISPEAHISSFLAKGKKTSTFLSGVDFDVFLIELAQELGCFPPVLFNDPAQHLLDQLEPIVAPTEELLGAKSYLADLKSTLQKWQKSEKVTISTRLREAILKGDWDAAIVLKNEVASNDDKEKLALAYRKKASALWDLALARRDKALHLQSISNAAEALKLSPGDYVPLIIWGNALNSIGSIEPKEETFRGCIDKYEKSLALKPNNSSALNGWGNGLL